MDPRRADLHTHTHHSDGQLAPEALVRKARERGIQVLAITDHDTIDALEAGYEAGMQHGVEVVAGVELSVTVGSQEIHLLGYRFDPSHAGLRTHLAAFRRSRHDRAAAMVERLNALGLPLSFDDVLAQADGGALGRPHVAQALEAAGLVGSYVDAFDKYLRDGAPAAVEKPLFPAEEALAMLHDAGGIGVLAHPGHWTQDRVVMHLIQVGLDGIETIHPSHDYMLTRYYRQIVSDFGLVETGGSDYHGFRPQDEENLGSFTIPLARQEQLQRRGLAGLAGGGQA